MRPRTLLAIAALAGAFYFLLPQIADVSSSWHALQHVNWAWLPVILALSALTYVASAMALTGAVPGHVPFGPAVLTQGASSFINRVSPANVGGMALNARFLHKSGTGTPAGVAAVGVNALAGAVMHGVLIVVFFALAGHDLTKAFKLPPASKILLALAVIIAVTGVVPGDPAGPPVDAQAADPRRPVRGGQPAAGRRQPGQAGPAVRRLGPDHPGLHRRAGRLGPGVRRGPGPDHARRGVPGRRGAGGGRPHARRPRRDRGGAGRRADRRGHAARARVLGRAAVPAGHLLAADDAMTRGVAGAPVPGFTAVASVVAEAGAALATVIAGFALPLALIVLCRFRRLLVLVVSYEVLTVLTTVFLLIVHRPLPFGMPAQFRWAGFAMPSAEIERLCFVLTSALYTLVPVGRPVAAPRRLGRSCDRPRDRAVPDAPGRGRADRCAARRDPRRERAAAGDAAVRP